MVPTSRAPHAVRIAILGGGTTTRALLTCLARQHATLSRIRVYDPDPTQCARLRADFPVFATTSVALAGRDARLLLWSEEPGALRPAVEALHTPALLPRDALHLTTAPGVSIQCFKKQTCQKRIARAILLFPCSQATGVSVLHSTSALRDSHCSLIEHVLSSMGPSLWLNHEFELEPFKNLPLDARALLARSLMSAYSAARQLNLQGQEARRLIADRLLMSVEGMALSAGALQTAQAGSD